MDWFWKLFDNIECVVLGHDYSESEYGIMYTKYTCRCCGKEKIE
jgi:hypothetical protein